ncbi:MAG TPA: flagellar biosynthesis protein FlhB [Candidatus Wunengus sp. YC61]|uniref:flagellar biosynthesis protein FlhB n=1 Tax=Candidatus Wunengus sp. YC61 TaxID=3367698 RepID=UPI0040273EC1
MGFSSDTEKTEQPTGKRVGKARSKGNIAFSPDLNNAVVLLAGIALLYVLGVITYNSLNNTMKLTLENLSLKDFNQSTAIEICTTHIYGLAKILFPILGGLLLIGLAISYYQTGFMCSFEALKFDINKLNIIAGAGKLFSTKSCIKLFFSVLKLLVVGGLAFLIIKKEFNDLMHAFDLGLAQIFGMLTKSMYTLSLRISVALLILAVLDFFYQKWQYKRSLRMTKQEVKDEGKETEGDPLIKGKIRAVQRQMAMKRMMAAVPTADVVVTNPTHYAVVLKYESTGMKAPKVVAKGADLLAKRIKDIAKKHNIPLVEDKSLAQTLYKTVEIGKEIPQKLYYAVAKVLSYVYQLKKERKRI